MNFRNPWGSGNSVFDHWSHNKWDGGGKYYEEIANLAEGPSQLVDDSELIKVKVWWTEVPEDDPERDRRIQLLESGKEVLPDKLKSLLLEVMDSSTELTEKIFDDFDIIIRKKFKDEQLSLPGHAADGSQHEVICYEFLASLRWGSGMGVNDLSTGKTNVIKRNYKRTTSTNEIGMLIIDIEMVPLYQPAFTSEGGSLIVKAFDLFMEFKVGDKVIFTNFTLGEILNR
jgi:hypothetical protein